VGDAPGAPSRRDDGTTSTVFRFQSGQQTIADYTSGPQRPANLLTTSTPATSTNPFMRAGNRRGLRYLTIANQNSFSITALTQRRRSRHETRYGFYSGITAHLPITDAAGTATT